jgi:hypothetical protein
VKSWIYSERGNFERGGERGREKGGELKNRFPLHFLLIDHQREKRNSVARKNMFRLFVLSLETVCQ